MTYFIRHGRDWMVGDAEKRRLREEHLIAIHYQPIRSLDPNEYNEKNRPVVGRFKRLAQDGGLVVSTHPPDRGCWIGKVLPESPVEFRDARADDGTKVVLKILKLEESKYFGATQALRLLAIQPQQQTFCRWPNVGTRAAKLYENGTHRISDVGDFLPFEQEVICGEFLRSELAPRFKLPQISHFTFPVGRTLPDIDIAGVSKNGERVLAQVTFKKRDELGDKLTVLRALNDHSTSLIMFCNDTDCVESDGVKFVPIATAMREMMKFSPALAESLDYHAQ